MVCQSNLCLGIASTVHTCQSMLLYAALHKRCCACFGERMLVWLCSLSEAAALLEALVNFVCTVRPSVWLLMAFVLFACKPLLCGPLHSMHCYIHCELRVSL